MKKISILLEILFFIKKIIEIKTTRVDYLLCKLLVINFLLICQFCI